MSACRTNGAVPLAGCASIGSETGVAGGSSDDGGEAFASGGDSAEEMDGGGDGGDAPATEQEAGDGKAAGGNGGQAAVSGDRLQVDRAIIRTGTVELRVEEQLSAVQSDIEQLEARQRSLEQRVAFATLRVELREPEPDRTPDEDPNFAASLGSAFLGSMATLGEMGTGFVLFAAGLAPFLLFLGVPTLAVGLLARRRFGLSRKSDQTPKDEDPTDSDTDPTGSGTESSTE